MASTRSNKMSLTAIFFLLLSFLNIAFAAPIAKDGTAVHFGDDTDLITRGTSGMPDDSKIPTITQAQYEAYLKQYFSQYLHDGICLYTGGSADQVKAFVAANPGKAISYFDAFETTDSKGVDNPNHPWYKAFGDLGAQDDADAASRALVSVSSGKRRVFGGADYQNYKTTWYYTEEMPILKKGGPGDSINHMIQNTKDMNGIMATEDNKIPGTFSYKPPYNKNTKNASAPCKKRDGCGAPTLPPKAKTNSAPSTPACKRAGTCPAKTPYGPTAEQTGPGGAEPATNDPAHPVTTTPPPETDPVHTTPIVEPEIHI